MVFVVGTQILRPYVLYALKIFGQGCQFAPYKRNRSFCSGECKQSRWPRWEMKYSFGRDLNKESFFLLFFIFL